LRLKNQDEGLSEQDLSLLRQVAGMCASEYGDVVHWAMGLLSSYTTELPESLDNCDDLQVEGRTRSVTNMPEISTEIYPNPVSSQLTVVLNGAANGQIMISGITGGELLTLELYEGNNEIDLKTINNGVYLVKVLSEDFEKTEKVIVIK